MVVHTSKKKSTELIPVLLCIWSKLAHCVIKSLLEFTIQVVNDILNLELRHAVNLRFIL